MWRRKKASASARDTVADLKSSVDREEAGSVAPPPARQPETALQKRVMSSGGNARSMNQSQHRSMPSEMEEVKLPSPSYTSSKTGFNVAPSGRDVDEPRAMEVATNEQFRDEDRLTNATNDPRIGTHGRKYEP